MSQIKASYLSSSLCAVQSASLDTLIRLGRSSDAAKTERLVLLGPHRTVLVPAASQHRGMLFDQEAFI